jgi:hypothetical protein
MEKEVNTRESIPIHLKGWLILFINSLIQLINHSSIQIMQSIESVGSHLGHQPTCTSKENVTGTSQDLAIPTSLQQGLAIVGFFGESSHLFLLFLVLGAGSRLFHPSECRRKARSRLERVSRGESGKADLPCAFDLVCRDLVVEGGQAPEGVGVGFLGVRVFGDLIWFGFMSCDC